MPRFTSENSPLASASSSSVKLLSRITCPHCWEHFAPETILWVSEHVDLLGDPRLGPEEQQRFLPSRFTIDGDAIDARGMTCHTLACPNCHLHIPRAMLEMEPLFFSILGSPASGKSFFLTTMTWQLRQLLPRDFRIAFTDADPAANRILNECEESLFLNHDDSRLTPLGNLIRKTELQGELYDTVAFGQQTVSYPRPFLFTIQPKDGHPAADAAALSRMLCLYDNAGEHFQPGQDRASSPVTRHLAQSRAILFLFDPTQDPRFRAACRGSGNPSVLQNSSRLTRQETILNEAALRVRKYAGLPQSALYDRPLIVILSKFDEWSTLIDWAEKDEPWKIHGTMTGVDVERITRQSSVLRDILARHCPETVAAAEGFARDVTYIAISSLGPKIELDPQSGVGAIRPRDIHPSGVAVPLVYALSRVLPRLIPRLIARAKSS